SQPPMARTPARLPRRHGAGCSMSDRSHNLRINPERLWSTIMETAAFGRTEKGGLRRLTLGPEDRQVRDWFRAACEAAGCTVKVDELGTMYAIRPGRNMDLPPIGCGSHLDTQPTAGKFDGVLGTLAGLELIRALGDAGIETEAPIAVVNWTKEEGSRFTPARKASVAYVGDCHPSDIPASEDDTQLAGGKFDGVLGTVAGIELIRALDDAGIETEAPIAVVNWTNEEGSRFAPAMMASAAYVGDFDPADILARRDAAGITVA